MVKHTKVRPAAAGRSIRVSSGRGKRKGHKRPPYNIYMSQTDYGTGREGMFVVSVKTTKKKLWIIAGVAVLAVVLLLLLGLHKKEQPAATASGATLLAADSAERLAFFQQYGWQVSDEPTEICEVIIPEEFNDVYENYNAIQKQQEMDLTPYKGKRVKRWTYQVTNYPNKTDGVYADILIYNGKVVGGDIHSSELNGFMHGFDKNLIGKQQDASSSQNQQIASRPSSPSSEALSSAAASASSQAVSTKEKSGT